VEPVTVKEVPTARLLAMVPVSPTDIEASAKKHRPLMVFDELHRPDIAADPEAEKQSPSRLIPATDKEPIRVESQVDNFPVTTSEFFPRVANDPPV
jgi:hypothetical protein